MAHGWTELGLNEDTKNKMEQKKRALEEKNDNNQTESVSSPAGCQKAQLGGAFFLVTEAAHEREYQIH